MLEISTCFCHWAWWLFFLMQRKMLKKKICYFSVLQISSIIYSIWTFFSPLKKKINNLISYGFVYPLSGQTFIMGSDQSKSVYMIVFYSDWLSISNARPWRSYMRLVVSAASKSTDRNFSGRLVKAAICKDGVESCLCAERSWRDQRDCVFWAGGNSYYNALRGNNV